MAFSEDVIEQAWNRARATCECKSWTHNHGSTRCNIRLSKYVRGKAGEGGWEAHRIKRSGGDELSNCEILCWSCHKRSQYE